MKSFKIYLTEKRKNPDQNPKISAYEALKPYKDNPKIYITFTGIDKVGINPHSGFNTPNGIYTYPLKEIWQGFDHTKGHVVVPFAGESPYVWILEENCKKFQIISEYNSSDYDNDMNKIRQLYDQKKILTNLKGMVDKGFSKNWVGIVKVIPKIYIVKVKKAPTQSNIGKFDDHFEWDDGKIGAILKDFELDPTNSILQDIADEIPLSDRLLKSTIDGGVIPPLKKRVLKMEIEAYFNIQLKNLAEAGLSPIDVLIDNATKKSLKKNPFSAFWNVTRWIAYNGNPDGTGITVGMDMAKYKKIKLPTFEKIPDKEGQPKNQVWHTDWTISVNQTAQVWNNILRLLGYCGFADKQGTGSIHPAEPMQAIFLSKNGFKVLDKWNNINPRKVYKTIKDFSKGNYGIDELVVDGNYLVLNNNVPPTMAMARIPIKGIKWSTENIKELARGFEEISKSKNQFMKEVFHNNLWMLPEKSFRSFLNRMTSVGGFRNPDVTASRLIKSLQKNKANPKSIKYVQDWLSAGQ